jgi:cytochrome c5
MHWFLLLVIAIAAGCADTSGLDRAATAQEMLPGQQTYENVCARCHKKGRGKAPAVGDRNAWENRSPLWVAVLEEHAKNGYLKMPAKGGDPSLSDYDVTAAAEYMLTLTFPERPPE